MLEEVSQPIAAFLASIFGGTEEEWEPRVRGFLWILILIFVAVGAFKIYKWWSSRK